MPDNYFVRYLPLLIHFLIAGALATGMVLLSWIIGYRRPTRAKLSPYECGMTPVGDARERFSVKFYLVAMLFILFDVEAVFLYPWAVILKELKARGQGLFAISEMFVYIAIVLVGYIPRFRELDEARLLGVRVARALERVAGDEDGGVVGEWEWEWGGRRR